MNERQIQLGIVNEIRSAIVCAAPNYTPRGWWECDLWAVTKAGYAVEYEIKLTLSDFRADAKKSQYHEHVRRPEGGWDRLERRKHDVITTHERAPSRFFYVVPEPLQAEVEPLLPTWAGLGVARPWGRGVRVRFLRDAPKLHTRKVGTREIALCQRRMWYRYWNLLGVRELQGVEIPSEVAEVLDDGGGA